MGSGFQLHCRKCIKGLNDRSPSTEPQEEDPGAYPIPFGTCDGVELGSRLDSIPPSMRYWAVDPKRANARWYNDMVEANNRYEEWLSTRPPGEYPVPFREGKRLDEIDDGIRHWAVHPDRSSARWYNRFKRANARYEQHLATTREPGEYPYPEGNHRDYTGMPIKDISQDVVWWALRASNRHQRWYQAMYDANKRILDNVYKSRSPGSEPIWFGVRYLGLRLDQAYERKGFMRWCYDPRRDESGALCRLKDLVERLKEWRRVHPERSGPRQRRKAAVILNPVGEVIGPWDDSQGSAGEDQYEKDGFIQSDSDEVERAPGSDDELTDDDDNSQDSDESTNSSVGMRPSERHPHKRRRTNVIMSDEEDSDEEDSDEGNVSAGRLGKQYRVQYESSDE